MSTPPPPPAGSPGTARSRTRWIIAAAAAGLAVLVAIVVLIVATTRGPADAVRDYYRSFPEGDCDLYLSVTTEAFRAGVVATCEEFKAERDYFRQFADYRAEVVRTEIRGDAATVWATWRPASSDEEPEAVPIHLVKADGWRITGIG